MTSLAELLNVQFTGILVAAFSLGALTILLIKAFAKTVGEHSIKLAGAMLVMAIAFAANNPWVYSISIFIVATLVTDLLFLEKFAAIVWRSDKYWEYRIRQGTSSDIENKITAEVGLETRDAPFPARDAKEEISLASNFERAALAALASGEGPFAPSRVKQHLLLESRSGERLIDVVVSGSGIRYIGEVKIIKGGIGKAARAAIESANAYRAYSQAMGKKVRVVPFLIVPGDVEVPDEINDMLSVLKFDAEASRFVNQREFLLSLSRWDVIAS